MKMRSVGLTCISLALTSAVIGNAYYHKKQFYPSVVYITKSNPSMAVIYAQAFIMVYLMGKLMRKIFFGVLRAAEFEHLMERSWYAVTETCLAFTVFRDDFNPKFIALFTLLLFLKCFHWLAEDRVDFMERSPVISLIFHVRVSSLLILLGVLDFTFIEHAYQSTVTKGASVQLVFGFEYAILATIVLNIAIKYALHTLDLNSDTPWESKTVFLLYTELVMGFVKVCLYVTFVGIMIRLYTLPLFAFRPMYYTMRKFKQAYSDVVLSRRAIQNMNTLYPDATPEELAAADNVCIICREEMTTASKKLPCNHIFHTACLRSWFQRQQTCPTCRLNILRTPPPAQAPPPPPRPFPFWQQPPVPGVPPAAPGPAGNADQRQAPRFTPMPPPFYPPPMMGMGLFPPPPMPPPDFNGLTDEELARLEGDTRENIIARMQCLRNVELLLNASVTVMNQYLSIAQSTAMRNAAAAAASNVPMPGPSGVPPTTSQATATASEASASGSVQPNPPSQENTTSSNETPSPSAPPSNDPAPSSSLGDSSATASQSGSATPASESPSRDSLRRLRLQKFAQE